ncbi:MAG: hypothetical protein AABY22_31045, partial [Nanoarchaeota archaeon]
MINILTIDSEFKSAQKLGFETTCSFDKKAEEFDNDIIIRWGNSVLMPSNDGKEKDFKNVLNQG